jgi:hypothetical protein
MTAEGGARMAPLTGLCDTTLAVVVALDETVTARLRFLRPPDVDDEFLDLLEVLHREMVNL